MNIKICLQVLLIFSLFNIPQQAFAEVMDKEPTLFAIWGYALICSLMCFLAGQYKWWLPIIISPIAIFFPLATIIETLDPHVGPAILNEAGWSYVLQAYAATFLVLLSIITRIIMGRNNISRIKPKLESS